jgi:hypothetical protein
MPSSKATSGASSQGARDSARCNDAAASDQIAASLDLRAFAFPRLTGLDVAFSTLRTDRALLNEATRRGFYNGCTPYNQLFSSLFFSGGKVEFKKDVPDDFRASAWAYMRAFMGSFEPKHEEKEAICAMLLSELAEVSGTPQDNATAK